MNDTDVVRKLLGIQSDIFCNGNILEAEKDGIKYSITCKNINKALYISCRAENIEDEIKKLPVVSKELIQVNQHKSKIKPGEPVVRNFVYLKGISRCNAKTFTDITLSEYFADFELK